MSKVNLTNLHIGPKGYQPNKGLFRKQLDGLGNCRLQKPNFLLNYTGIKHKEEHWGHRRTSVWGGLILNRCVMRVQLSREVIFRNGRVVLWEVVALIAEWADPNLCNVVNNGEGIENGPAYPAAKRGIWEDRDVWDGLQWGIDGCNRDDTACCFLFRAREDIPSHSNPILRLKIEKFCHPLLDSSRVILSL